MIGETHPFTTLIMIADGKKGENNHLLNFNKFFLRNRLFFRNIFLIFLVISQKLFDSQRHTIPHFNPLKELIRHLLKSNCRRILHFWGMRKNICPLFLPIRTLEHIWYLNYLPLYETVLIQIKWSSEINWQVKLQQ